MDGADLTDQRIIKYRVDDRLFVHLKLQSCKLYNNKYITALT